MLMCFRRGLIPCLLVLLLQGRVAADVVLDDSDWRSPGLVARARGVEHEMVPSLLLKTEFEKPAFLFDPTDDETITSITDFQGKLYLGSCTRPAGTATGSVFTYAPESHHWEKVHQVNEEGLVRLEVYGDRLYIPGYDANDGGWDLGNIYIHDGDTWVEHRTVPRAVHIYGLAVYKDRIYVSADIFDEPPPGKSVDEASEEGLPIYGRVVSSGDGGETWREEYRGPEEGQDVGFMTVFEDTLVLNAHGDLVVFDGTSWERLSLDPNVLLVLDYCAAGDVLLLGTSVGLCAFEGEKFRMLDVLRGRGMHVRAIRRFGSRWVMVGTRIPGGTLGHGPGGTGYMYLKGDEEPFWCWVQVIPDLVFRAGVLGEADAQREIEEHEPEEWASWISCEEMIVSAHVFKGRTFFGTHPEGRVLVLPVAQKGALDSAPRPIPGKIPGKGTYSIVWESATPPGTSCRFQIRTAPTREALESAPFVGPHEASSFFEQPGTEFEVGEPGFLQYRVILETDDPALTPYLKRVTVRAAR
jgi:hypothetical protein